MTGAADGAAPTVKSQESRGWLPLGPGRRCGCRSLSPTVDIYHACSVSNGFLKNLSCQPLHMMSSFLSGFQKHHSSLPHTSRLWVCLKGINLCRGVSSLSVTCGLCGPVWAGSGGEGLTGPGDTPFLLGCNREALGGMLFLVRCLPSGPNSPIYLC